MVVDRHAQLIAGIDGIVRGENNRRIRNAERKRRERCKKYSRKRMPNRFDSAEGARQESPLQDGSPESEQA